MGKCNTTTCVSANLVVNFSQPTSAIASPNIITQSSSTTLTEKGRYNLKVDLKEFSPGFYLCRFEVNGTLIRKSKFTISK